MSVRFSNDGKFPLENSLEIVCKTIEEDEFCKYIISALKTTQYLRLKRNNDIIIKHK